MSIWHNTKSVVDSLAFFFDTSNLKSVTPMGVNSEGIETLRDMISGNPIASYNYPYVVGKTYYTAYALEWNEADRTPASRQGITPGINDITSTKLYDMSRCLGMFVWDDDTETWIDDSYFNGEHIDGHCYDIHDNLAADGVTLESDVLVADYGNIRSLFPNATYVFIGSHAADNTDTVADVLNIITELGFPVSEIDIVFRPEYIIIGKPGRKITQYYVRENVNTTVAHLNFGLPIEGNHGGILLNGVDQYMSFASPLVDQQYKWSLEFVVKPYVLSGHILCPSNAGVDQYIRVDSNGDINLVLAESTDTGSRTHIIPAGMSTSDYAHIVVCRSETGVQGYVNGQLTYDASDTAISDYFGGTWRFGQRGNSTNWFNGEIAIFKAYKKILTADEVNQNYMSLKGRFGF